ncbi:MAG: PAS domain-containing protein [Gammaproteobacteria bacterium]|jgi:signal transduction histidine kinase|nr:PAS domain-containing protein [Gammaproteobacteria bacterium]
MVNSTIRARLLEARMSARECQLQLAETASGLGVWTLEPTTGDLAWSTRCRTLLGSPAEAEGTFEALLSRIHAEDQLQVKRAFAQAAHLRREFTVEFRDLNGAWIRCTGRPHASASNREGVGLSGILLAASDRTEEGSRLGAVVNRLDRLREVERNSVASRLQSEVAQRISALQSRLESLAVNSTVPATTRAEVVALSAAAAECMDAVRAAIFEMSPPGVAELGFAGALERYASEQAEAAGIELAFDVAATSLPDLPLLESLYAVARAGIDNVVRHARARHMRVAVKCDDEELLLRVEDDGVGITNADLMKDSACSLFASSERLADSGGELRVSGKPDQGTVLEASIALRQRIRPLRQNVTKLRVA